MNLSKNDILEIAHVKTVSKNNYFEYLINF